MLRAKGIIPPREAVKEVTEEDLVNIVESTIAEKSRGEFRGGDVIAEVHSTSYRLYGQSAVPFGDLMHIRLLHLPYQTILRQKY